MRPQDKFCPYCGGYWIDGDVSCFACGMSLSTAEKLGFCGPLDDPMRFKNRKKCSECGRSDPDVPMGRVC